MERTSGFTDSSTPVQQHLIEVSRLTRAQCRGTDRSVGMTIAFSEVGLYAGDKTHGSQSLRYHQATLHNLLAHLSRSPKGLQDVPEMF